MQPPPGSVSNPQRQGAEGWFPWAIGIFTAVAVVVWAGAALSAIAASGTARGVTMGGAGQALVRLPSHLGRPAAAWPRPVQAQLPGPVLYWVCQAVVITTAVGVGTGAWRLRRRFGDGAPGPLGVKADAGFARRRDLRRLAVAAPVEGRLTIGRSSGRLVACEPQASLAVIGPTGCGKTAGFAIPALLEWRGPVIATSVKADLLDATIEHRARRGTVWVYDPTGCSGHQPNPWSPLGACTTWPGAMRVAAWMTEAAQARLDTLADGDYWFSQARKGLAPYLYAAAGTGASIADLVRWVDAGGRPGDVEEALKRVAADAAARADGGAAPPPWDDVFDQSVALCRRLMADAGDEHAEMAQRPFTEWSLELAARVIDIVEEEWCAEIRRRGAASPEQADGDPLAPLAAARALWDKDARLRDSVFATMENVVAGWADPTVAAASCVRDGATAGGFGQPIDLAEWLAGDNTIYVVASSHEQARLRPVLTVLVQQAVRAAYDTAADHGGRLPHPCLVLLDEAGNVAPLRDLPAYASTARSHGITLVSVWQDLAQVKAAYRDRAQTVLNNHRAKLFGTGIADDATLEYVSRLIGDEHRVERNLSTDLHGGRRSVSEHRNYRRAAPVDVLRRIRPGEGVLLYGSELPAHVRLRPWFADPGLRAAAGRPDLVLPDHPRRRTHGRRQR